MHQPIPERFVDPSWNAPLDGAGVVKAIPDSATIAGMFLEPLAHAMRQAGVTGQVARERYTPFRFYPLREHAKLLLEACERLYPNKPLRQALRKLGRAAPAALLSSTLGRVTLGAAQGPLEIVQALAKSYSLNLRPSLAEVREERPGRLIVRLSSVHYFLDSHHVGVFEGALQHAGVRGSVKINSHDPHTADLLCTWGG
jgi:uncharacterized protein (TIGR02265 family)